MANHPDLKLCVADEWHLTETPPFRLVLGRLAVQSVGAELDAQRREIDAWEEGRTIPRHDWPTT